MGFKDNLKKYRMQAGFKSAKQLADALEIPYTTYMGYENKNNWPPLDTLLKMAYLLNIDVNTLVGYIPPAQKTLEMILNNRGITYTKQQDFYELNYGKNEKTVKLSASDFEKILKQTDKNYEDDMLQQRAFNEQLYFLLFADEIKNYVFDDIMERDNVNAADFEQLLKFMAFIEKIYNEILKEQTKIKKGRS